MAFSYSEKGAYYNALDPSSGNFAVNAYWRTAYLGAPTSPQTPAQIQQITGLAASGIQNIEIGTLEPKAWETIPKQHFEEIRRLGKLVIRDFEKEGKPSPISVHAPILEPTGFSERGWSEDLWREQQKIMADVVRKAAVLGPSTPVTIHASHAPSMRIRYDPAEAKAELEKIYKLPEDQRRLYKAEIDRLQRGEILESEIVVDPVTGEATQLKREWLEYPTGPVLFTPETRIESINRTSWLEKIKSIQEIRSKLIQNKEAYDRRQLSQEEYNAAKEFLSKELELTVESAFDSAIRTFEKAAENLPEKAEEFSRYANQLKTEIQRAGSVEEKANKLIQISSLPQFTPPRFLPFESFGGHKAAEAFANMALESVKAAKEKKMPLESAPIVSIENVHPMFLGGRSESLKQIINQSRKIFSEKVQKELKISESEAKKLAEKLIGATWDVGHINILKRYGYEPKEVERELKQIAKDIKHVHISDNFGFEDVHLPPGMGNVDVKKQLEILEKEGKLGKIRAIVEAGAWVQFFKESPWPHTLQYFNLPMYGWQAAPGWQEGIGAYFMGTSGYAAGYGNILPEIHFSEYGSGFSVGLPPQRAPAKGEKSTFSGTPMS